nr:hypothetical protein CFP56_58008 [Quercus suber]
MDDKGWRHKMRKHMDDKWWRHKMRKHMDNKGWRQKLRKPIFLRRQDRLPLMMMRHRPLMIIKKAQQQKIGLKGMVLQS